MPLLERESALEIPGGWFAEARAGRGRLVLVGGEAGVGKMALVEEFALRQRQAARVLWGACDPLTTPRPLGPLADIAPPRSAADSTSCFATGRLARSCFPPCSNGCTMPG